MNENDLRVYLIIFMIIGCVVLLIAFINHYLYTLVENQGIMSTGIILNIPSVRMYNRTKNLLFDYIRIQIEQEDGTQTVVDKEVFSSFKHRHKIGDVIDIIYGGNNEFLIHVVGDSENLHKWNQTILISLGLSASVIPVIIIVLKSLI